MATNQGHQNTKEKVKDAATSVANQAGDMASKAGDMASKVANQASDMASKVVHKVGDTAESATSSVGSGLQSAAGALRENMPNRGMLGSAAGAVADTLESSGRYLEDKGLSGMSDDIAGVIKRYPIPAVLLALGLGYLIASSTRS
jgi:hypothetical protein